MLNAFINHSAKFAFTAAGAFAGVTSRIAHCDSNTNEVSSALVEIELKNGRKVPRAIVGSSMMSFSALMERNPIALYELVQKCKNEKHELWVGTKPVLKDFALLDGNGYTHRSVCDVLLSAITGDGLDMSLGSPYKPKAKL